MPAPSSSNVAIAVMAKQPALGTVKTRLAEVLSPAERLELYTAMLEDKLDQVASLPDAAPWAAFTPADARSELTAAGGRRVRLIGQRGDDLGQRLAHVAADLFEAGHRAVILVDSDTPNLPSAHLLEAIRALDRGAEVVLGPAWDGGYYLIGLARPMPELFRGIAWSTPRVLEETVRIAEGLGRSIHFLTSWFDVDTPADLDRLARQLSWGSAAHPDHPRRTAAVLSAIRPVAAARARDEQWTTISQRPAYENRWMRLEENLVRTTNGRLTLYGIVTCSRCLGVLPLRADRHVLLVRQFRYVARRPTFEIPTGAAHEGESLEAAAQRELAEEAGVRAGRLRHLATFHTSKSIMDEVADVYLGEDLTPARTDPDPTEEITIHAFPLEEALRMVESGEIVDSMSVVALLSASRLLGS